MLTRFSYKVTSVSHFVIKRLHIKREDILIESLENLNITYSKNSEVRGECNNSRPADIVAHFDCGYDIGFIFPNEKDHTSSVIYDHGGFYQKSEQVEVILARIEATYWSSQLHTNENGQPCL